MSKENTPEEQVEDNLIPIGKYVIYDKTSKTFGLTWQAQGIIYREKGMICSYSGSSEWCHHFFCQMIDLYSGASPYNYALGSCDHEKRIPEIPKETILNWIEKSKNKTWWKKMVESFDFVFDNLPQINE
jgi:hypothetical protein